MIPDAAVEAAHIPNAELRERGLRFCPGCQATRLRRQSVGAGILPEPAVEAAAEVFVHITGTRSRQAAEAVLEAAAPHLASAWHDAVSEAYVEGALSADQASVMWNKNPYRGQA